MMISRGDMYMFQSFKLPLQDGSTPLHESVRQGDVATTQALIAAGADITAKDANWATPTALATTCSVCWALLKHLTINKATLTSHPELLVSVAAARCATLAASAETFPTTALFLQAYQLEPSFLWAPPEARNTLFVWAKNAFVAQLAANTLAFAELPDDCAGDVLEWFEMTMTRKDALHIATHCSSPEAHAWLREAVAAAVAVSANSLDCVRFAHGLFTGELSVSYASLYRTFRHERHLNCGLQLKQATWRLYRIAFQKVPTSLSASKKWYAGDF